MDDYFQILIFSKYAEVRVKDLVAILKENCNNENQDEFPDFYVSNLYMIFAIFGDRSFE